jgi:hypothetical protein
VLGKKKYFDSFERKQASRARGQIDIAGARATDFLGFFQQGISAQIRGGASFGQLTQGPQFKAAAEQAGIVELVKENTDSSRALAIHGQGSSRRPKQSATCNAIT